MLKWILLISFFYIIPVSIAGEKLDKQADDSAINDSMQKSDQHESKFHSDIYNILNNDRDEELFEDTDTQREETEYPQLDQMQEGEIDAETLFKSAFADNLDLDERERRLVAVVQKYPESIWVQDSLWVLAQIANARGETADYILWYRRLVEDFPDPSIQYFTTLQPPFHNSGIPQILYIIDQQGRRYAHGDQGIYTFNPIPFSVRYELGLAYESLGYLNLAEKEYRRAMNSLPPIEMLRDIVQQRLDSIGTVLTDFED